MTGNTKETTTTTGFQIYAETLEEARYKFKELLQTKCLLFEDEEDGEISVTLPSGREVGFLVSAP